MNKKTGKLITLEGSEGAGKSTAMQVIAAVLSEWGMEFVATREPGGEYNAEKIREILLYSEHLDTTTELLLMFASRNEHLMKKIRPALAAGQWVISDRFIDASFAYQGGGRGVDLAVIEYLDQLVVGQTQPNLTLFLDVDPQIGLRRAAGRSSKDRIEQESLRFFERIRQAYLDRQQQFPERIKVIDANAEVAQVRQQIRQVVEQYLEQLDG